MYFIRSSPSVPLSSMFLPYRWQASMEPNSAMHHGVTANARQVESADLRSRVSRGVPLNAGSGHAIGVCMVPPTAVFDELMTASAPSLRAPSTPLSQVAGDIAKLT